MRIVRSMVLISFVTLLSAAVLVLLLHGMPSVFAQTGTPPSSSISSSSGPVSWDFGPVVAGTVTNVGIQDVCPPGICDDHDLTVLLPAPAATFYQTMTAKLTITYTWTSTVPTDLDIFAISPSGADHGPGSPDDTSTGSRVSATARFRSRGGDSNHYHPAHNSAATAARSGCANLCELSRP